MASKLKIVAAKLLMGASMLAGWIGVGMFWLKAKLEDAANGLSK